MHQIARTTTALKNEERGKKEEEKKDKKQKKNDTNRCFLIYNNYSRSWSKIKFLVNTVSILSLESQSSSGKTTVSAACSL